MGRLDEGKVLLVSVAMVHSKGRVDDVVRVGKGVGERDGVGAKGSAEVRDMGSDPVHLVTTLTKKAPRNFYKVTYLLGIKEAVLEKGTRVFYNIVQTVQAAEI